jgi:hypothetical protein
MAVGHAPDDVHVGAGGLVMILMMLVFWGS